jgi:hypothetical protein
MIRKQKSVGQSLDWWLVYKSAKMGYSKRQLQESQDRKTTITV